MDKRFTMKQYEEYLNKIGNQVDGCLDVIKSSFAGTNYRKHCPEYFKDEYERALNNEDTIKEVLNSKLLKARK